MARWARSPQDAVLILVATARELGHDPDHLTPRQALESWVAAAQVPFRVPPITEADGLRYGYEVRDAAFHLELVRRFACREGAGHCQVRCDISVPLVPELAARGSYAEWCFEPPAAPGRQAWAAALGSRAEWSSIERANGAEVTITADGMPPA